MGRLTLTRSRFVPSTLQLSRRGCVLTSDAPLSLSIPLQNMQFELEDLVEQANEIQETLGRSYAVPDEIDEADLEAGTTIIL